MKRFFIAIANIFRRKCQTCNKPLEFKNEWEKKYAIFCKDCGWKPEPLLKEEGDKE